MKTETLEAIASFIREGGIDIEDIVIHGNDAIGHSELSFYRGEEKEEWYAGENEWFYIGGAICLIRRVDSSSFAYGWQNAQESHHNLHIWSV